MLIAHIEFRVREADREDALNLLISEAETVRNMDGNLKFLASLNPEHPETIEITHEWECEAGFASYLGSESFAKVGAALGPKFLAPPVSKRFRAEPIEAEPHSR